jgi:hypothetical protein
MPKPKTTSVTLREEQLKALHKLRATFELAGKELTLGEAIFNVHIIMRELFNIVGLEGMATLAETIEAIKEGKPPHQAFTEWLDKHLELFEKATKKQRA